MCSCLLLSYQWVLLSRVWLLLHSFPSAVFTQCWDPPSPSALQAEQPHSHSLTSCQRCLSPLIISMVLWWTHSTSCVLLLVSLALGTASCGLTSAEQTGIIPSLDTLAVLFLMQSRMPEVQGHIAGTWWDCCLPEPQNPFLQSFKILLSQHRASSRCWCLFLPRCRALYFLSKCMRFLFAHFSAYQDLWTVAQPMDESATLPLWACWGSALFCYSLLNSAGPSTDPWGTALATCLLLNFGPLITMVGPPSRPLKTQVHLLTSL